MSALLGFSLAGGLWPYYFVPFLPFGNRNSSPILLPALYLQSMELVLYPIVSQLEGVYLKSQWDLGLQIFEMVMQQLWGLVWWNKCILHCEKNINFGGQVQDVILWIWFVPKVAHVGNLVSRVTMQRWDGNFKRWGLVEGDWLTGSWSLSWWANAGHRVN